MLWHFTRPRDFFSFLVHYFTPAVIRDAVSLALKLINFVDGFQPNFIVFLVSLLILPLNEYGLAADCGFGCFPCWYDYLHLDFPIHCERGPTLGVVVHSDIRVTAHLQINWGIFVNDSNMELSVLVDRAV